MSWRPERRAPAAGAAGLQYPRLGFEKQKTFGRGVEPPCVFAGRTTRWLDFHPVRSHDNLICRDIPIGEPVALLRQPATPKLNPTSGRHWTELTPDRSPASYRYDVVGPRKTSSQYRAFAAEHASLFTVLCRARASCRTAGAGRLRARQRVRKALSGNCACTHRRVFFPPQAG